MLQEWELRIGNFETLGILGWIYICFDIREVKLPEESLEDPLVLVISQELSEDECLGIDLRCCFQYLYLGLDSHLFSPPCRWLSIPFLTLQKKTYQS